MSCLPFSHHLGYHGIRTFYNKTEKRNLVVPFASWLNLQTASFDGIKNDPIDERAWAGMGRGWPIKMARKDKGVVLRLDPLPQAQLSYSIDFQPAEPDGIDFSVQFEFGRRPDAGAAKFLATWPCYMNAYDDVRFFYPRGTSPREFEWVALGEKPDIVLGDLVGYAHKQTSFQVQQQALPVGYGLIGERALIIMFSDPALQFFVVNTGGHFGFMPVQNPAWDFSYELKDYPLNRPVKFSGRIIYTRFTGPEQVLSRYAQWQETLKP
jgi:hypothetical protein